MAVSFFLLAALSACTDKSTQQDPAPAPIVNQQRLQELDREPGTWLTGGRDFQQRYFSPLNSINTENVAGLGYAWHHDFDSEHGFESTPSVVDGVLYASGPTGTVVALDAVTGQEKWSFAPQIDPASIRRVCCGVVNRGLAIWQGKVFVGALDGFLYALNIEDGSIAWKTDTITDHERGYTVTGAPYIANDLVIIGNAGAEFDARGYVTAYESTTGEQRWRFFTVPGNPDNGFEHPELEAAAKTWDPNSLWQVGLGGTVWDAMAYDPQLDILYVGTGNAAPYPRKLRSPEGGDNLYLASILALNPHDGKLIWYYQTTPGDNWDFTATQKMILADLEIEGETRQVIMQAPKNGFFYVLDRVTGELLSAKPYAVTTWASHIDMDTGRPVETEQAEYFYQPKLIFPSAAGAHNWQPMAYNPHTGLVYVPVIESAAIWTMPTEPFEYIKGGINSTSLYIFPIRGEWGLDSELARTLPSLEELSEGQPDTTVRGFLRAWDPVTQTLAWEKETSGPWAGDMFAFWNGGGVMTTAGGLVFQGRATGALVALDAASGEELANIDMAAGMMAAPMTYAIEGNQYVAILTGVGGGIGQVHVPGSAAYEYGNKGRLIVLKLGGGDVPKRARVEHDESDGFPIPPVLRSGSETQVAEGADIFLRHCAKCHANIDGRGAGIPDLRRMNALAHSEFDNIVLKGTRVDRGMGDFSDLLSADQVEATHKYLIELAWKAYENAKAPSLPHQPAARE
ncbi:MAG: PQQ-dependent dehydrogenase, methanol/ethanol family [Proteobacteria bacterium]|nr:PQQ-dependent dehydrogenase, methanol/ethanol family [Pseudomonadota bacterium]